MDQIGLFTGAADPAGDPDGPVEPEPTAEPLASLARALPPGLRLGTSSWAFPGWSGLVYRERASEQRLAREGLSAYAASPLHRTVGLDRAFYRPPPADEFRSLATQVPDGFRFLVKAWQGVTRPDADDRGRTHGPVGPLRTDGRPNPDFLDPSVAVDRVIAAALRGLGDRLGPVLFQFPPLDLGRRSPFGGPVGLLDMLGSFLLELPQTNPPVLVAIELRNREMFEPEPATRLAQILRDTGACLGLVHHPNLPSVRAQAAAMRSAGHPIEAMPGLVCRWMLRHDQTYDGARRRYEPFDRLLDADVSARTEIAEAVLAATAAGREAWVIANNKAEGSAPLTLQRLARAIVEQRSRVDD